jgi:transglutaminase-like putative cysteine protease
VTINPFDFFVEENCQHYPFSYEKQLNKELAPYFEIKENGPLLTAWLEALKLEPVDFRFQPKPEKGEPDIIDKRPNIVHYLVELNQRLQQQIGYTVRMAPGVQSCEETLAKGSGSCRDSAWLLVQILRHLGLAARFVSGYLIQLVVDQKSLDGPSGPEKDITDLHAWTEVYISGAGWVGLDPTSGLFAGEGHIPLACTPDPASAAPIVGTTDKCQITFRHENNIKRIHEDPRVTNPIAKNSGRPY